MNLLTIPQVKNHLVLIAEEIIRVEALSNYSCIYLSNGKKLVAAKVLHWFEDELPTEMFVRVHRSHLINKLFVQKMNGRRSNTLLLNNGETICVSRRKLLSIKRQLTD